MPKGKSNRQKDAGNFFLLAFETNLSTNESERGKKSPPSLSFYIHSVRVVVKSIKLMMGKCYFVSN